jgi:hypothetical protein
LNEDDAFVQYTSPLPPEQLFDGDDLDGGFGADGFVDWDLANEHVTPAAADTIVPTDSRDEDADEVVRSPCQSEDDASVASCRTVETFNEDAEEEVVQIAEQLCFSSEAALAELPPPFPEYGLYQLNHRPWTIHEGHEVLEQRTHCGIQADGLKRLRVYPRPPRTLCKLCFRFWTDRMTTREAGEDCSAPVE